MKRKKLNKRKLNNRGMSLVEVLVAMMILTISGIAFLQSFSYSMRNNSLAKSKHQALTYAQSMMETCKAYNIKELNSGKYMVFSAGSYWHAEDPTTGKHTYKLQDVDSKFDITVVLTPASSDAAGAVVKSDIFNIHNPSSNTDACLIQSIDAEQDKILEAAFDEMLNAGNDDLKDYLTYGLGDYSFLEMDKIEITSRTISLVSGVDVSGKQIVTASVTYTYKVTDLEYSYFDVDGTAQTDTFSSPSDYTLTYNYNDFFTGTTLKNVYLYYYPMYHGINGVSGLKDVWLSGSDDIIQLTNGLTDSVNFYLVKQKLPAATASRQTTMDNMVKAYESQYDVSVTRVSGDMMLYSNLAESIYAASIGTFSNSGFDADTVVDGMLLKEKDKQLVYKVEITVTDDDGNTLVSLEGSMNDQ